MSKKEGGTENSVDAAVQELEGHKKKPSKVRLITVASNCNFSRNNLRTNRKTKIGRKTTVWILQETN